MKKLITVLGIILFLLFNPIFQTNNIIDNENTNPGITSTEAIDENNDFEILAGQ